ncbi:olfactory receptor class A-like protein 1 [Ambystoma mexicanum]|uniref:olfactory receptor class A-like protein 1 n=1 Tax=Ambystoma mexicanum TaxID=8296 RepID=UPI0037E79739
MHLLDLAQGGIILLQMALGCLGNLAILAFYVYVWATDHTLKPVESIVSHLAFANLTSLMLRGVPHVTTLFGAKKVLTSTGCKSVIYLYRVTRALSVTTTCILSVFQSVTIAPITSLWGKFKLRLPSYLIPSFAISWLVNFLSYVVVPLNTVAPENNTIPVNAVNLGFCYTLRVSRFSSAEDVLSQMYFFGIDVIPVVIMILASGHIVLTLRIHQQRVRYVQTSRKNQTMGAEAQAAKTIIQLVALYVFFYGVDMAIMAYTNIIRKQSLILSDIRVIFSYCFPSLSPFVMIRFNRRISHMLASGKMKKAHLSEKHPSAISNFGM